MKAIKLQAETLRPDQFDQWNRFVDESPQGDVFCYSWWLDAITKRDFKILAIFEKDEIVAGIPLAYYLGKINEPPLTRTLGPLYKNLGYLSEHDQITQQRKWLNALLDQIPIDEVEQFCTSHNFSDWLPFKWRGYKQDTRYTYLIDFKNKTIDDVFKSLNQNKKRDIVKAEKNKLSIETSDDFEVFYHLVELTYERQYLNFSFPKSDFKDLDETLRKKEQRKIFIVSNETGLAIAAVYLAFDQKSANYLVGGTHPDFRDLGASTLALWEAVKYFQNKVSHFNFCGSNIESIERYFRGFGGELTPYFHIFAEKPVVHQKEQIQAIEVVKEVPALQPPPPDNWKYHVKLILDHSLLLVKKAMYKLHIRFEESVKVSVVTPCYNHGKFIHEMLDSVLKQTYKNLEVIIVNDGSTDDTATILDGIKHKKVKIFHTENRGPAYARNLAISMAGGEIILNLDADNKIAPTLIQKCVAVFNAQPNAGIVYSDLEYIGARSGGFDLPDYTLEGMLRANCIDASACFRKADWAKTEGYSSVLKFTYEDFDFWLSILELGRNVHKIKEPLTFYRTYENPKNCRSGRTKQHPDQVEEVIVQAFQRHKALYKKVPHIYQEFAEREIQFNKKIKQQKTEATPPVFSIITPTYNRPQLLKRTIESVLAQSFGNFEQIIIDDANDPETKRMVLGFADQRLKYVSHEKPSGAGAAYNTGMRNAKGEFINFLDDDDEYLPGTLDKMLKGFNDNSFKPDYIWTGVVKVLDTDDGEVETETRVWPAIFNTHEAGLSVATAIGNGYGFSIKRTCIDAIGEYDSSLTTGQDTDFLIRLSKKFKFRTLPEVMVKIHHHGKGQLTDLKRTKVRWDCYGRIMQQHFDFLSQYFKLIHLHSLAYLPLCYQLKKKNAGRKFIWQMIKKYPFKKLLYQDLWCYERYGKDYNSMKNIGFPNSLKRKPSLNSEPCNKKISNEPPGKELKDGRINVLSIGSSSSVFLAELYGRISKLSDNKILYTIAGEKQFTDGIDCSFMDLIAYRNIFERRWDFNFSLFRLLLKFVLERKNFRSFISLRRELIFLALKTNFSVWHLIKEIRTLLNKRYFGNTILRPVFTDYDVVHIQFLSLENTEFIWYVPDTTKVIGTFLGSDLMRKSGIENAFYLEKFLDKTDVFMTPSLEMREITLSKFGREYYPKFKEARFPLQFNLFADFDNTKDVASIRRNFTIDLGLDPDKKNLVVGHNGSKFNNHLPVLKALKDSDLIDLNDYNIILPISYYPDGPGYKSELMAAIEDIPNCCMIEDLLFGKELAALRMSSDFFIHVLQSDAWAATLIESIYAGAIPIVGSWLPYDNYYRFEIPLIRVDDFSEIPKKIVSPEYKQSQQIRDNINKFLRAEHVLENWIDIYNSMFV